MFSLMLISLGLVTAFVYLWPEHDTQSDKISIGKTPAISVAQKKPVHTVSMLETQNLIPPPTTDTLDSESASSPPDSADSASEVIPANEDVLPPVPQSNESLYHAAIEQHSEEAGSNEITIILSAPASDEVIRNETDIAQTEPAESETTLATPSSANDTAIAAPAQYIDQLVHTVVRGDTLWHIAQRYIHNPYRYPELARLNKIRNPDLIYPGDRVRIIRIYQKRTPAPTGE